MVGVWERGRFTTAEPETPITDHTVLVVAGTAAQTVPWTKPADLPIDPTSQVPAGYDEIRYTVRIKGNGIPRADPEDPRAADGDVAE